MGMTREEAKKAFEEDLPKVSQFSPKMASAYKVAISALAENTGDLIRRIEVESVLHNNLHAFIDTDQLNQLYKDINRLHAYSFPDPAENKGDLISKEKVKDIVRSGISTDTEADKEYVYGLIDSIPSADVRPNIHGHWKRRTYIGNHETVTMNVCSECGKEFGWDVETGIAISDNNFCPNCGADMREPKPIGVFKCLNDSVTGKPIQDMRGDKAEC